MIQFRADADKLPMFGPAAAILVDRVESQRRISVVDSGVALGSAAFARLLEIARLGPNGVTGSSAENLLPLTVAALGNVGVVHTVGFPVMERDKVPVSFITGWVKRRPQRDLRSGHGLPLP